MYWATLRPTLQDQAEYCGWDNLPRWGATASRGLLCLRFMPPVHTSVVRPVHASGSCLGCASGYAAGTTRSTVYLVWRPFGKMISSWVPDTWYSVLLLPLGLTATQPPDS